MALTPYKTPSGTFQCSDTEFPLISIRSQGFYYLQYIPLLPSLRRWLPFVGPKLNNLILVSSSQQPNPVAQSVVLDQWIKLILSYARYRKQFIIRVEDAEAAGSDWDEILRNERINRMQGVPFLAYAEWLMLYRPNIVFTSLCYSCCDGST